MTLFQQLYLGEAVVKAKKKRRSPICAFEDHGTTAVANFQKIMDYQPARVVDKYGKYNYHYCWFEAITLHILSSLFKAYALFGTKNLSTHI